MQKVKRETFAISDLVVVALAPPPDDPPLMIGDWCRLNSGGPYCLVVDGNEWDVVVSWANGADNHPEYSFSRASVRRRGHK